jgi:chromosome segregation ATPase
MFSALAWSLLLLAIACPGPAIAQVQAITERDLTEPWTHAKAALHSLAPVSAKLSASERGGLERQLGQLDDGLARLQAQEEKAAIRIVAVPEFAYSAAESSAEMSAQVAEIAQRFNTLFRDAGLHDDPNVRAMQTSLAALQRLMADRNALERDVIQAVGSGSKNLIQALAGQWWNGAESVNSVREAVAALRQQLAAAPTSEN